MPRSYTHPVRMGYLPSPFAVEFDERKFPALAASSHLSHRSSVARHGGAQQPGVRDRSTHVLRTGTFRINEQREVLNTSRPPSQRAGRSMTVGALTRRYASSTTLTL